MRLFRLFFMAMMLARVFFAETAFAAAYQLYELGTPVIGTAAVGQAAVAEDASTSYFNPAGMSLLPATQVMVGSQMLLPFVNFSKSVPANTIFGDNGSNAGMLTPGLGLFLASRYSPQLSFGLSVTSPYGGVLNYTDGWVGRYVVQNVFFYTININPSLAYRINDWVSAGLGIAIEYMNLQQTVAIPNRFTELIDGQIKVSLANFAPGFNLGLMFTPRPCTRIGLAYRSRITHHLHGNATFLRIEPTPDTSTRMIMPNNLILSLSQQWNRFNLLAEVGWANWSTMHNTILHIADYSAVTQLDWKDTWRAGLAGQFHVNPCLVFQAGVSYDSSPTTAAKRLPDLPMDRQIRVGAGVMVQLIRQATLGASYEYMNMGHANINNVSSVGNLVGSYSRNYVNAVQVSLNVQV